MSPRRRLLLVFVAAALLVAAVVVVGQLVATRGPDVAPDARPAQDPVRERL